MFIFNKLKKFDKNKKAIRELTQRVCKTEKELTKYINKYLKNEEKWQLINQLLQDINTSLEIECLLEHINSQILKLVDVDICSIYLYNPEKKHLVHKYINSNASIETASYMDNFINNNNYNNELYTSILENPNIFTVKTLSNKDLKPNYYIIPIINYNNFMGIIFLYKNTDSLNYEEINILEIIAKNIAMTLKNAELYGKLKQNNKNQIEFIGNLAHEFKTPLNSIIGFSKLILENQNTPRELIEKNLHNVLKSAKHLFKLIEDIQDTSIVESGNLKLKYENFNTQTIIQEVLSQAQYGNSINNTIFVPMLINCNIEADIKRFRQVIYNLTSNAVKFAENASEIKIITYIEDDLFFFEITNKGQIITPEDQGKIFNIFYHKSRQILDEYHQGAGLGLPLCKKIIELHEGTINFTSDEKGGTTFIFSLPITKSRVNA